MPAPTLNAAPRRAARTVDKPSMNFGDCGPHELLDMTHAGLRLGRRTPEAMRRLVRLYAIDGRVFGVIVTHVVAIHLLGIGDMEGLDAFRRGDLAHAGVVAAYEATGIKPPRELAEV